ncbi:MAG TPA: SecC motif-containing protein [Psychromonas hadalis]|nr:SecC motif-containing protein [Psychromonas hadalis]
MNPDSPCPCKSGDLYQDCCQPLHAGKAIAKTSKQLMQSRFSAFMLQQGNYLFTTYHPDYRAVLTPELLSEKTLNWKNLEIVNSKETAKKGIVEFKAWYFDENDRLACHHERSNFLKDGKQWQYCDGEFFHTDLKKLKRNDHCPCGSGKKYKKCCYQ